MTPAELQRLTFDFRAARAVYAGVELGVFEALESRPVELADLAAKLGADPRGLRILLNALASLGLVEHDGHTWGLADTAAKVLVPGGEDYLGNLFLHDLWHWDSWAGLGAAVHDGAPPQRRPDDRYLGDPAVLARFLPNYNRAMEQSGREVLPPLVELIAGLAPRTILDLGGGTGALLLALLDRLPEAHGVLAEHGFALKGARSNAQSRPSASRLEFVELDFENQDLPGTHDVVVLSRVLMGFDAERAERTIERAAGALGPGGTLVIADFSAQSRVGALLSLDMLLNTGGQVHDGHRLLEWMQKAGLEALEHGQLLAWADFWLGRKPR